LVPIFVCPAGEISRATYRDHRKPSIEASFDNVLGSNQMGCLGDYDCAGPSVLVRQTSEHARFTLRGVGDRANTDNFGCLPPVADLPNVGARRFGIAHGNDECVRETFIDQLASLPDTVEGGWPQHEYDIRALGWVRGWKDVDGQPRNDH
jgi:hypothetical protein